MPRQYPWASAVYSRRCGQRWARRGTRRAATGRSPPKGPRLRQSVDLQQAGGQHLRDRRFRQLLASRRCALQLCLGIDGTFVLNGPRELDQLVIVRRDGATVRLFTRRGHDWTDRYPAIAAAAAKLRAKSFILDGEAVVTGENGVAVFDALHRRSGAADSIRSAQGHRVEAAERAVSVEAAAAARPSQRHRRSAAPSRSPSQLWPIGNALFIGLQWRAR
jgi:ATP dependent DNA ligase domain